MKIAIVTEVWRPTINGVVTRLAATVDELRRAGHQVLVIAPQVGPTEPDVPGLQVRTVPTFSVRFVYGGQPWGRPFGGVGRLLAEFQPDVVHVANPVVLGVAGVVAARRRHLPVVCSYHTDVAAYAGYYHLGWLRPVIWWVLRTVHRKARINLVTSRTAATQLDEERVPRVRLWPRGVDLHRFHPPALPSVRDDGATRTALYVGRLAGEKGLDVLAELAAVPDLRLVIVGDGPGRDALAATLDGSQVEFAGPLLGDDLTAAYRRADVFVFPSTTETLGLVLLEALASGLPVVAADSPASRELLEHCGAARLWAPGRPGALAQAVTELLGRSGPAELADTARSTVRHLSWSASTAQLVDYYQTAAQTPVPASRGQRLRRQCARFATIGFTNALIDLAVFNGLVAASPTTQSLRLSAYNTVAVLLALANSYWWNSRWTFRPGETESPRHPVGRRRLLFVAQGLINVAVNDIAVVGVAAALNASGTINPTVVANSSKVAGMVAASIVSFLVMRLVIFRHVGHETATALDS